MSGVITIEEIARLAAVSRSTVSRVLNDHPNVRPHVRKRVLDVMHDHNYVPNAAARSLASNRSRTIGLLIPRQAAQIFAQPFFPLMIQSISGACGETGYFLMLSMVTSDMEQRFYNQVLRGRHFDGVIMLSSDIDDPLLPLLLRDGTPLVLIGRHPYLEGMAWIDAENREGARLATSHLLSHGYKRVATITGPLSMLVGVDRRDGYKQAVVDYSLPIRPELIVEGDFTQEGAYAAMKRLLALSERPEAVFAASDTMAIGALHAVHEAGMRVPEDVALIGFDDLPAAAATSPPLTTIRQPIAAMGAAAVQALIRQIEQPNAPKMALRLPADLVLRASCGPGHAG